MKRNPKRNKRDIQKAMPQVINILRSLRQSIFAGALPKKAKSSGLCGIWKDDWNAEDILRIYGKVLRTNAA